MIHTVWVIPLPSVTNQEEQFLKFKPTTNLQKAKHDHVFNSQNTWHNLFDVIDVHMMPLKFQYSSNNKNKYQITNSFLWVSHIAIFHRDSEQIKYRTFLGSVIEIENESLAPILVAYLYFILPQILKIIFEILLFFSQSETCGGVRSSDSQRAKLGTIDDREDASQFIKCY